MFHTFRFPGCTAPSYIYIHFLFDYYVFIYVLHIYIYLPICSAQKVSKWRSQPIHSPSLTSKSSQTFSLPSFSNLAYRSLLFTLNRIHVADLILEKSSNEKHFIQMSHLWPQKSHDFFSVFRTAVKLRYQYVNKTNA